MNSFRFILTFSSVALFACKDSSSTKTVSIDSPVVNKTTTQDTSQPVQKTDTSNRYYWEQLPIRTVADLILRDSIRPVSSPVIYNMLDSLSSDSKQSRHFYFKVFNKIMNKADGDVAESIGGYALTYVQNYPQEFLDNSLAFSKNQLEAWAGNIGIELYLSSHESDNVKEAFDQMVVLFNDNCKACNSNQRNRLKEFNNLIWRTIKENQQADKGQS
ncbi:MAG TPA: hypothetical protein VF622_10060 [Segetibacter sp.]|jgi:hypothetical protein